MNDKMKIYYRELDNVQMLLETPIDIITITGFMSWEQMLTHLEYYANQIGYEVKGL